jgi:intermediate cleaving peptidase 55
MYYTARTFPASGTFTPPQRDLYAAVLAAQKRLVTLCTESSGLSLYELHRLSCDFLRTELKQIGFVLESGDLERVLYPHFLSHPIGIGEFAFSVYSTTMAYFVDLHESSNLDRTGS